MSSTVTSSDVISLIIFAMTEWPVFKASVDEAQANGTDMLAGVLAAKAKLESDMAQLEKDINTMPEDSKG